MKKQNNTKREWILFGVAIASFLIGTGLSIAGFCVNPTGVIDGSVLGMVGEFLTFAGAIFGVGEYGVIISKRIKKAAEGDED